MSGPAAYLSEHPLAYVLALAGSGGMCGYALTVASRRGPPWRRLGYAALGVQCAAELVGVVVATEGARRRLR